MPPVEYDQTHHQNKLTEERNQEIRDQQMQDSLEAALTETPLPETDTQETKSSIQSTRDPSDVETFIQRGELVKQLNALQGLSASERQQLASALKRMDGAEQVELMSQLTALSNADKLATNELSDRKQEILKNIVKEISVNGEIHQGIKATCTATVLTSRLARENPAEYARLNIELAMNGKTTMAGGEELRIDKSDKFGTDKGDGNFPGRSLSMDMLQTSLMQKAAEFKDPAAIYDDKLGVIKSASGNYSGLHQDQTQFLNNQLFNSASTRFDSATIAANGISQSELLNKIDQGLNNQAGVPVELKWSADGAHLHHQVLVTEIRDGRVYFDNPWGATSGQPPRRDEGNGLESMSVEEFQQRIASVTVDTPGTTANEGQIQGTGNRETTNPVMVVTDSNGVELEVEIVQTSPTLEQQIANGQVILANPGSAFLAKEEGKARAGTVQEAEEDQRDERTTAKKTNYFGEEEDMF